MTCDLNVPFWWWKWAWINSLESQINLMTCAKQKTWWLYNYPWEYFFYFVSVMAFYFTQTMYASLIYWRSLCFVLKKVGAVALFSWGNHCITSFKYRAWIHYPPFSFSIYLLSLTFQLLYYKAVRGNTDSKLNPNS
jgi:hypothetical protein